MFLLPPSAWAELSVLILALHSALVVTAMPVITGNLPNTESLARLEARATPGRQTMSLYFEILSNTPNIGPHSRYWLGKKKAFEVITEDHVSPRGSRAQSRNRRFPYCVQLTQNLLYFC
ncbi:hypothetical protein FB446DRAFT_419104 [Lentinula raphanica]|nr:hypothetical protein FB446DRAFT_419104 [Lentinula raphanica]